ncbi:polysaccharide biosynthesis protein [Thiotrichales bacterium 19S9-12]|nr:polysaccharide biosynthesis protein [Thiotrichales bacterium 19S9-11]MCF6810950.1 polysaccharide biosynthesis protein [Thiotrichales bacterium 19S9-12]
MKKSLLKNKGAWLVLAYDLSMALLSWVIVHGLTFSSLRQFSATQFLYILIAFSISIKLYRTYASLWKTVSSDDLKRNIYAVILGSILFFVFEFFSNRLVSIARTEVLFYPVFTLMMMLSGRFIYRQYLFKRKVKDAKKLIIIGAGKGAALFLRENESLSSPYQVLAIFDDKPSLHGKIIRGASVIGPTDLLFEKKLLEKFPADEVLIAIPSISSKELRQINRKCLTLSLPIKILPSLMDLARGDRVTDIRNIELEDLLGREPVSIESDKLKLAYDNKTVLVTGGAGSIGSEIIRQLLKESKPKAIIVLDHDEYSLYKLEQELLANQTKSKVLFILANILDQQYIEQIFSNNHIDIVFHAAAYKHVPMLEEQVEIAVKNNVIGTKTIADLSSKYNIERFLLVSTDKAVNPTNVMGATKRVAELYVSSLRSKTKYVVTRFGNVLGSAGSVIPLFKEQLEKGGPITVTHQDIERYFMMIPEASLLVILSCAIASGGETYVLEMGKPVKIVKLAEQLISLAGKKPYEDIEIIFTGLRKGEKMYEELFYSKEKLNASGYDKLLIGSSTKISEAEIKKLFSKIQIARNNKEILSFIKNLR